MKIFTDASGKGRVATYNETTGEMKYLEGLSGTNNHLEYLAVKLALENLPNGSEAMIYSDSMLVIKQLSREWSIREPRLREIAKQCHDIVFDKGLTVTYIWIPRKKNPAGKFLG